MQYARLRCLPMLLVLAVGAARADDTDTVIGMERALWVAWRAHDLKAIEAVTAPDYYSVNEEGPAHAIGLAQIRKDFADYALRDFRLGGMVARVIAPDAIVVVYNAHMTGSAAGKDLSRGVAEASVWAKRGGAWRNVLLHEVTRARHEDGVDP